MFTEPQHEIARKTIQWEPAWCMRTDTRTERQTYRRLYESA